MATTTSTIKYIAEPNIKKGNVPDLIGAPPRSLESDNIYINSLPIAYITPCLPKFSEGISSFRLIPKWDVYNKILESLGYTISSKPLKVVFVADSFPSETFSNEYGQTFLSRITDVVSDTARDITQMTGHRLASESVRSILHGIEETGSLGKGISSVGLKAMDEISEFSENISKNENLSWGKGFVKLSDKLLAGQKIDFPSVWKNSSYGVNYSLQVRLYNPSPGNQEMTEKFIIAPLAALLTLACPIIQGDGETYSYPFFIKVRTNGLFSLEAGAISSITVTKGGDQGLIAWNKRVGMIDVRIELQQLFSTMVIGKSGADRPVLGEYLETLKSGSNIEPIYSSSTEKRIPEKTSDYKYNPSSIKGIPEVDLYADSSPRVPQSIREINLALQQNKPNIEET